MSRLFRIINCRGGRDDPGVAGADDMPIVAEVLNSNEFRHAIEELAVELGRDSAAVRAEAAVYLREMGATHNPMVQRAFHRFSAWMVRGYDIIAKDHQLAELRRLGDRHTLIFLISHRSYLDEFSLPPQLASAGIKPCFGMAGTNLDFFPLGALARRNGVVHVRRASGDSPVYRLALRALVGRMVTTGHNLVWAIEGGRSRTGKLRPPRYGLLRYVTDAIASAHAAEALIIPVSIMYDQLPVHEVELMVSESRGGNKPPEDFKWLAEYARRLSARLGHIYLDFGDPLPVYERITELASNGCDNKQAVERLALEVCHRLNQTTPVTATAAVCVAMLGQDRALTLDEVATTLAPLAHYLSARGCKVAGAENLNDRATVARTLRSLVDSGVLSCYSGGPETVWGIREEQHLVAAVYRNSAVHVLLVRAIAEMALLELAQTPSGTTRTAWEAALALRELLKFDFFFAGRDEFAEELWDELELLAGTRHDAAADIDPATAARWLQDSTLLVAHLVLRPYIDAYRVVAEELTRSDPPNDIDEKLFLDRCLRLAKQWSLQRAITSEESISVEMFSTALKMARHRDLLDSDASEADEKRRQLARQLTELQRAADTLAAMSDTRIAVEVGS